MHARLVLRAGKGVLFREVQGVLIERDSTDMYVLVSSIGIDQLCYFLAYSSLLPSLLFFQPSPIIPDYSTSHIIVS